MRQNGFYPIAARLLAAFVVSAIGALGSRTAFAETLTLEAYLEQVRASNSAFLASQETQKSLPLQAEEAALPLTPSFNAQAGLTEDMKQGTTALQPIRTLASPWSLGLSQNFLSGTNVQIGYAFNYTSLTYAPISLPGPFASLGSALVAAYPFYDAGPMLRVNQSLLRDFMGHNTIAGLRRVAAQADAGAKSERFRAHQIEFQAEQAYWNLSLAHDAVETAHGSLDRTQRLLDSTRKKAALNLAEAADVLQVEASQKLRELNLQAAEQDLVASRRAFNTLRNKVGVDVAETVERLKDRVEQALPVPNQAPGERLDVQASERSAEVAHLNALQASYRSLPDVNAFASVAWNGHGAATGSTSHDSLTAASTSLRETLNGHHPTYLIGASVVVPLGFHAYDRVQQGYDEAEKAAREQVDAAKFGAAQDWEDLKQRIADTDARVALARQIEQTQQQKLKEETQRFKEGRTTTFQLLSFEEDYSQAQLTTLRFAEARLLLDAQGRLFNAR